MRPAREVACENLTFCCPGAANGHIPACDRLTAAIEADRRELVEACAKAALPLPADDDLEDPYRRIRALIPKEAP